MTIEEKIETMPQEIADEYCRNWERTHELVSLMPGDPLAGLPGQSSLAPLEVYKEKAELSQRRIAILKEFGIEYHRDYRLVKAFGMRARELHERQKTTAET